MAGSNESQFIDSVLDEIDKAVSNYAVVPSITNRNEIPDTGEIPGPDSTSTWFRIEDVICVFVDMKGSTQMSARYEPQRTAGIYRFFTGTAVRILHQFEPAYIDVRGDGAFALFNSKQPYRALCAAVSFKTFADDQFHSKVKDKTGLSLGAHIGIDRATVLVQKVGLRRHNGRTDRQNEVWAGKPVNMASKLASKGEMGELWVSDRYFKLLEDEHATNSCGCVDGEVSDDSKERPSLWTPQDVSAEDMFDFNTAHALKSHWCPNHGAEYCETLLSLDK